MAGGGRNGKSIVMAGSGGQNQLLRVQTMATQDQTMTTRDRAMTAYIKCISMGIYIVQVVLVHCSTCRKI